MKKFVLVSSIALAAWLASNTVQAQPSAIAGQACDVNWLNGACGKGSISEGGSTGFISCRQLHDDPCDCGPKGRDSK